MFSSVSSPAACAWPVSPASASWATLALAVLDLVLGRLGRLLLGRLALAALGIVGALVEAGLLERLGQAARHHADGVAPSST